ncbi:MAG: hypothetical protein JHC30_01295 [Caldisericum sp.]|nr:hypothetical protein [Caldisericum sp.]
MAAINFPFFPLNNEGSYFCGKLKIDEINNILEIKEIKPSSGIGLPLTSYIGTDALELDQIHELKERCGEESNILATIHYLKIYRSTKILHVLLYIGEDRGKFGIKIVPRQNTQSADIEEFFIIGLPDNFEQKKAFNEIVIETPISSHSFSSKDIQIERVNIDKITTYPQILYWPFYATMQNNSLFSLDVIQTLLGSLVLEEKSYYKTYLFPFFPAPLLSYEYYLLRSQSGRSNIDVNKLSSINIYDSGALLAEIDLNNLVTHLNHCVYNMIIDAWSLVKTVKGKKELSFTPSHIEKIQSDKYNSLNCSLNSRALLKVLANAFLVQGSTFSVESQDKKENAAQGRKDFRDYIKRKLPHRLTPVYVELDSRKTIFYQLHLIPLGTQGSENTNGQKIAVWRTYVAYNRGQFLLNLLQKLEEIAKNADRNPNESTKLMAAYLLYLNELIKEYRDSVKKNIDVRLDVRILSKKITLLLLEYGLHGVSHLLIRYLSEELKIPKSRLFETTAIIIPKSDSESQRKFSDLYEAVESTPYFVNVVIDGYHYRLRGASGQHPKGIILVFDTQSYSSSYWFEVLKNFNFKNFASEMLKYFDDKNCDRYWQSRREKIKPALLVADNYLSKKLGDSTQSILTKFTEYLRSLFGLDGLDDMLSLPLSEFRRLMLHKEGLIRDFLEEIVRPTDIDKTERDFKKEVRYYLQAIYEYVVPFCFDGCYNCVQIDKGCSLKNPLLKEWVVSRNIANLILEDVVKSDGQPP